MQDDSLFIYKENNESSIDYSLFANTNIIVLNEVVNITSGLTSELQKFVSNGGSIVVFPNKKSALESYNTSFKNLQLPQLVKLDTSNTKTQTINFEQGLYEGVFDKIDQRMDLPKVFEHFEFAKTTNSNSQNLVLLQNGQFLISVNPLGSGKIYLFSIPSDETSSNLLKHALFVPTLIKMSILSLKPSPVYYKTALNEVIVLNSTSNFSDKPLHIVKDDKNVDVIPEHRLLNNTTALYTQNQITEAGHYNVEENNVIIKDLAFNDTITFAKTN
jgi:hypothetical protein